MSDTVKALVVWHEAPVRHLTHCSVCVIDNGYWLRHDGRAGRITLHFIQTEDFDLAGFWAEHGLPVVECSVNEGLLPWPLIPATCVALVKRVLGVHAPFVVTSRQLYSYLERLHAVSIAQGPIPTGATASPAEARRPGRCSSQEESARVGTAP